MLISLTRHVRSASQFGLMLVFAILFVGPAKCLPGQTNPNVLFVRGAERSGGFLEAGSDSQRTEQLADINNTSTANRNHGWFQLQQTLVAAGFNVNQIVEPLESNAPATGPTTGVGVAFDQMDLSVYDVLVFGSNNGVYTNEAVDSVETYIRSGGGAIFISDANFGGNWADASNSDQQFLDRFGLIAHQDLGTYSLERAAGDFLVPDHPILEGVDRFDGEGVTPIRVGTLAPGVDVTILANAKNRTRLNNNPNGQGSSRAARPGDAVLLYATVDQGRLIGHFDRNTFFNLGGAGTNINRFDNQQLAINIFRAAAGPVAIPEPSGNVPVFLAAMGWLASRRRY